MSHPAIPPMHYTPLATDCELIAEMKKTRESGESNIHIDENCVASCNLTEFLDTLDILQFKRIKLKVNGLLMSDYDMASKLISRGVRIFEIVFLHSDPQEHDEKAGRNSFKLLLGSIHNAYQASMDLDIPVICQFTLRFDDPAQWKIAIEELADLYPSHFRIEGPIIDAEHAREAVHKGNEKGVWVELVSPIIDEDIKNHFIAA